MEDAGSKELDVVGAEQVSRVEEPPRVVPNVFLLEGGEVDLVNVFLCVKNARMW